MGTFGGALEARQIDASDGKLTADVTGEVEQEEGVLVIRRIQVSMRLVAPDGAREKVERVPPEQTGCAILEVSANLTLSDYGRVARRPSLGKFFTAQLKCGAIPSVRSSTIRRMKARSPLRRSP